jgi:acetylornithine deacetylase/succinyl-diaminopimelate desuccinylase-like protein
MRETYDKTVWGQVEKVGKGTKANYDPAKKTITFCFNRGPETSSDQLKNLRETLMKELRDLGYTSRMKYNGEVIADNILEEEVVLLRKNHKLIIQLKNRLSKDTEKEPASS